MAVTSILYKRNPYTTELEDIANQWFEDKHLPTNDLTTPFRFNLVSADNVGSTVALDAQYLVIKKSDTFGIESVHAITEFLYNPPGPIGIILYGNQKSINRLCKLCQAFMSFFVEDVKEPEDSF